LFLSTIVIAFLLLDWQFLKQQTISDKIKNKIKRGKRGKLYFISDFSKLGDKKTVSRILLQLSKSKCTCLDPECNQIIL